MPDDALPSRSGETGLFGKADRPQTVNLSEATDEQVRALAALCGVTSGEWLRALIEERVWGTAEIMARMSQRRAPMGIRRIVGD